ncbi:MAG: BON domain-containing protein, partial [Bryobacteraceae bacterium]
MSDSDLESAIKNRLDSNPQVRDANIDIDASVERNEAILAGKVPSQDVKDNALELARDSRRSLLVVDRLEVERRDVPRAEYTEEMAVRQRSRARELGDSLGDSIGDAWVHAKITTRLVADMDTPARKINVDV